MEADSGRDVAAGREWLDAVGQGAAGRDVAILDDQVDGVGRPFVAEVVALGDDVVDEEFEVGKDGGDGRAWPESCATNPSAWRRTTQVKHR